MRIFILFILSCMAATGLQAQQSLNGSGGQAGGSGGSASYSVGQVVFSAYSGGGGAVNQGVQQPYEFYTVSNVADDRYSLQMTVYPNPVSYALFLKIDQGAWETGMFAELYDLTGARMFMREVNGEITEMPVAGLANGAYLLQVTGQDQQIRQTFKIIKH